MAETKKTAGAPAPATPETGTTASQAKTETVAVDQKVAALEAALKAEQDKNKALEAELKDAGKVVAELKEKLAEGKSPDLTVTVGKKKYLVVGGFKKKGKAYSKEDIAADAKLAEELIEKGSQLLTEIK